MAVVPLTRYQEHNLVGCVWAPDWGSGGRGFKSRRPDHTRTGVLYCWQNTCRTSLLWGLPPELLGLAPAGSLRGDPGLPGFSVCGSVGSMANHPYHLVASLLLLTANAAVWTAYVLFNTLLS